MGAETLSSYDAAASNAAVVLNHARSERKNGVENTIIHIHIDNNMGKIKDEKNFVYSPPPSSKESEDPCPTRTMLLNFGNHLGTSNDETLAKASKGLEPNLEEGEIILSRPMVSPFHDTNLADILRENKVGEVILTGVSTSGVVLGLVQSAVDHGLGITVVKDACMDPDPELHSALLK